MRHTFKALEAPTWVNFAAAAQVIQLRRTRNGPEIIAALRNLTCGTRAAIASATRSLSRRPKRAISLLTQPAT